MWINGENFRTMREADLLFGPYAERLPNIRYVNLEDPSVKNDFGYPTEGYESPYGSAQVVMIYDAARVPNPPTSVTGLLDWIRANPGKFTYPTIPDFVGSVFIRHIFYHVAGDHSRLMGSFDQSVYDEVAPRTWKLLNDIEPSLWREGNTYPESQAQMQDLFANGEIHFNVSYNPNSAANLVAQGRYPDSTRTFVFDSGTIANSHYVAIPYNSPHKAGAMVLANLLLDPATQYEKNKPDVWGDPTILDIPRLPQEWQERFRELPTHPSTLPASVLNGHKLPELQAAWLSAIEMGWTEHVLQQ
jgi:putative spermidine/putrescine transport system substrate-binding protein